MTESGKPTSPSIRSKVSGHVKSNEGALLSGATVSCFGMETKTLADGYFVLDGLDAGEYKIKVGLQGFTPTSRDISIRNEKEVTLDFVLSKSIGTAKIQGHIYEMKSKEVIRTGGSAILILPITNRYVHFDKNGYYEFSQLSAGLYNIHTLIPGYKDCNALLRVSEGEIKNHDFLCKNIDIEEPPWG